MTSKSPKCRLDYQTFVRICSFVCRKACEITVCKLLIQKYSGFASAKAKTNASNYKSEETFVIAGISIAIKRRIFVHDRRLNVNCDIPSILDYYFHTQNTA